jgi:hypothetical protein
LFVTHCRLHPTLHISIADAAFHRDEAVWGAGRGDDEEDLEDQMMKVAVTQLRQRLDRLWWHNCSGRPERVRAEALAAASEARVAGLERVAVAAERVAVAARDGRFLLREAIGPVERIVDAAEAMWKSARIRV